MEKEDTYKSCKLMLTMIKARRRVCAIVEFVTADKGPERQYCRLVKSCSC